MKGLKIFCIVSLIILLGFLAILVSIGLDTPKNYDVGEAKYKIEKVCKDFINFDITAEECQAALEEIDLYPSLNRAEGDKREALWHLHYTKGLLIEELNNPDNCREIESDFWCLYYDDILNFEF